MVESRPKDFFIHKEKTVSGNHDLLVSDVTVVISFKSSTFLLPVILSANFKRNKYHSNISRMFYHFFSRSQ